jgi:hypothetical protein
MLGKYAAEYFRCSVCGFMQTEEPYWLNEAYSSAINEIDLGTVNRAIIGSRAVEGLILSSFDERAKFVDYGAGYGVFVRLMRDRGFDFYWRDRYCENLFAKNFIAKDGMRFELLTAFEVFEHLSDPISEIEKMLALCENVLFSTLLVPDGAQTGKWWYFGPDHGQHISFYTIESLRVLAERFGLRLCSDGRELHLLSRKRVNDRVFRFLARNNRWCRLAIHILRRRHSIRSLLLADFAAVSGQVIE